MEGGGGRGGKNKGWVERGGGVEGSKVFVSEESLGGWGGGDTEM